MIINLGLQTKRNIRQNFFQTINHEDLENKDANKTNSSEQLFEQDTSEDEDFEIPAFLRRQKF